MGKKKEKLVISSWKGIPTIRLKPAKLKQTAPTIRVGRYFGMAANRAGILRKLLNPLLPEPANRAMIYHLQDVFYQWLRTGALNDRRPADDIPFFKDFSFNEKTGLNQLLNVPLTVERLSNGQLVLQLPTFDPVQQVKSPEGTSSINICIAVAGLTINNPALQHYWQTHLSIQNLPGILEPQQIELPVATGPGKLLIVLVALQYFADKAVHPFADRLPRKPAGIAGSFYN